MTMSTRIVALCAVVLVTVLTGCNPAGGGLPYLDKSQIAAVVTVQPVADNAPGPTTTYYADCTFNYKTGTNEVDVASAIVKINGVTLENIPSVGPHYFHSSNVGSLKAGDAVELTVTDDRLGYIEASTTVPDSVTGFTLTPGLPAAGVENTETSYTMRWTGTGAPYYLAFLYFYEDTTYIGHGGYAYTLSGLSQLFTSADTYWDAANSHFLKFKLEALNTVSLPGFASWSALRAAGVTRVAQHNMP